MRPFLLLVFMLFAGVVFSQNENSSHTVFLKNGSVVYGQVLKSENQERVRIRLSGAEIIELNRSEVLQVRNSNEKFALFDDARRVREQGVYTSFSVHSLTAKRSSFDGEELRWGLGAHFSAGYRFFPALGIGGGVGIDVHQYFFVPVYFELSGFVVNKKFRTKFRHLRSRSGAQNPDRRFPFFYSIQVGSSLPVEGWFENEDFREINGGLMFYPAAGFLFPARSGNAFRLDVGYKIQHFTEDYDSPWWVAYEMKDRITLKSFALRVGWVF